MTDRPTYDELETRVRELEQADFERRQADEALRETNLLLEGVLDGLPDIIGIQKPDHTMVRYNKAGYEALNLTHEQVFGKRCFDLLGRTVICEKCATAQALKSKKLETVEQLVPELDRYYLCRSNPVLDDNGEVCLIIEQLHDITERKKAEGLLRDREQRLRSLFEGVPVGLYRTDMEGRIVEANPALLKMLGFPDLSSLQKFTSSELMVKPEVQTEMRHVLQEQGEIQGYEFQLYRQDGSIIWVRDSARSVRTLDGQVLYEGSLEDITEHKQYEERLVMMAEMIDSAPGSITVHDLEGRFLYANRRTFDLHGYDEDEFRGINLRDLDVPESETLIAERMRQIGEEGEAQFEVAHFRKDGTSFPLAVVAKLVEWNGKPAVLSIASDITASKRAEEEARRRENLLQRIFEILPIGLWFADKNGTLLRGNPMGVRIWGAEPKVPISEYGVFKAWRLPSREPVGPDDWALAKTIRNGVTIVDELLEIETFDGKRKTILNYTAPVLDDNGNVEGAIVVNLDISDRKALESQLAQAHKMEAIGTLAGGIAHDFNNILSIIVGNTELAMVDLPDWSPAQENLQEVKEATLRARELVKQILLFARQKEHTISNIRLEPIAKESLKMLRASIPTTVEIRENIEERLRPVLADPSQIQQIIMNLCTNAGQVMEAEGGVLTFTLDIADLTAPLHTIVEELSPGRYVRIQVRDTGPGIPPENLERIFDPFFTTKGVGEGTGLGLAVVHGIVQDRNGGIVVESEEGRGTTFSIYLPASEIESVAITAEEKMDLPRGTERILFVDDEPMIMKLGQRMLERQGYHVETRASGTDALECFKHDPRRFDLIVTDMTMPGLRGDRLAEEILAIRPDVPVILSTGYSRQISKEKAHEMGIRAFVMKPLTQHELANTVRQVLDNK